MKAPRRKCRGLSTLALIPADQARQVMVLAEAAGRLLDGRSLAIVWRKEIADRVVMLARERGIQPGLGVLQVGSRPDSEVYVRRKREACEESGMHCRVEKLPATVGEREVRGAVEALSCDKHLDGVLVQLPLPDHIRPGPITEALHPQKDVDGLNPATVGRLALRNVPPLFTPATAKGIMELLSRHGLSADGCRAVILGTSNAVSLPLQFLLRDAGAKSVCSVSPKDALWEEGLDLAKGADVLVAAVGSPRGVGKAHIKPGSVVIDVGINARPKELVEGGEESDWPLSSDGSFRVAGDVDARAALDLGCAVTPVPGGAGPMTVAALLDSVCSAATSRRLSPSV